MEMLCRKIVNRGRYGTRIQIKFKFLDSLQRQVRPSRCSLWVQPTAALGPPEVEQL